jgi:hypothetical protein
MGHTPPFCGRLRVIGDEIKNLRTDPPWPEGGKGSAIRVVAKAQWTITNHLLGNHPGTFQGKSLSLRMSLQNGRSKTAETDGEVLH